MWWYHVCKLCLQALQACYMAGKAMQYAHVRYLQLLRWLDTSYEHHHLMAEGG